MDWLYGGIDNYCVLGVQVYDSFSEGRVYLIDCLFLNQMIFRVTKSVLR
jgi:hypothetical protein